ncbi:hypothetical protein KAZ57_01225 [Patescibacteria group bacterium]|nr:hypothetical protein [Patescibacteria group bacterium]
MVTLDDLSDIARQGAAAYDELAEKIVKTLTSGFERQKMYSRRRLATFSLQDLSGKNKVSIEVKEDGALRSITFWMFCYKPKIEKRRYKSNYVHLTIIRNGYAILKLSRSSSEVPCDRTQILEYLEEWSSLAQEIIESLKVGYQDITKTIEYISNAEGETSD